MNKPVDLTATCTLQRGMPVVTLRLRPKWEGIIADAAPLSAAHKQQLSKAYLGDILEMLAFDTALTEPWKGGRELARKHTHLQIDQDGTATITRALTREEFKALKLPFNREQLNWHHMRLSAAAKSWNDGRAEWMFQEVAENAISGTVAFRDIHTFFKASDEWFPSVGVVSQLHDFWDSPEERKLTETWLEEHGIGQLGILDRGGYSLVMETNGDFVVRIQSKKEPHVLSDAPQVLPPVFSMETEHAYIDILPRMPGKALGSKTMSPTTKMLEEAVKEHGVVFSDAYDKNVMRLPDGTPIIVDLGAVRKITNPDYVVTPNPDLQKQWLTEDGTPRTHGFCPWLADTAPGKKERFAQQAMANGHYNVPLQPLDEAIAKLVDRLPDDTRTKIDAAYTKCKDDESRPRHLPKDHRPASSAALAIRNMLERSQNRR